MKALRNYLDKIKPNFEEGGKYHAFRSVFEGFESFLFVPNATSKTGTHIHDAIDSKRIMSFVVIALMPALLFGMYNVGYQHYHATGVEGRFIEMFVYGFLAVLPKIIVSYVVGLGIEFIVAQWKKEEIQEGFLVTGMLIPMIVPVDCPLWMLAVATAFSVIFCKEVFGQVNAQVEFANIFGNFALRLMKVHYTHEQMMSFNSDKESLEDFQKDFFDRVDAFYYWLLEDPDYAMLADKQYLELSQDNTGIPSSIKLLVANNKHIWNMIISIHKDFSAICNDLKLPVNSTASQELHAISERISLLREKYVVLR